MNIFLGFGLFVCSRSDRFWDPLVYIMFGSSGGGVGRYDTPLLYQLFKSRRGK